MKLITLDNLKTFLDKLLEQISTDVYSKKEVDEKLSKMNTKSDGYSKAEIDEKLKEMGKSNNNSDADKFFDWLKERNYNMKNFKGLENAFPILTFTPPKFNPPTAGTNDIHGTGSPNTIIEFDNKKYEINDEGNWTIISDKPFEKGVMYKLNYYNYSNKCNLLSFEVVGEGAPIKYSIPPEDNVTVLTYDIINKYDLKDDVILPPTVIKIENNAFNFNSNIKSVKSLSVTTIGDGAFSFCSNLTFASFPSATTIGNQAFWYCKKIETIILNDKIDPNTLSHIDFRPTYIIYNQDKSKKFNRETEQWENV